MPQRKLLLVAAAVFVFAAAVWALAARAQTPVPYQFQILHGFVYGSPNDGSGPESSVVLDQKGNVYGATYGGGTNISGTAYELSPGADGQWTETILHNFPSYQGDGETPVGVTIDAAGNLYGMTQSGGAGVHCTSDFGCGTVFELSPGADGEWTETILWNFCSLPNCADGGGAAAAPALGPGGVLYGVTAQTAFKLAPGSNGWTLTPLYTFCSLPNCADGESPDGSLILDAKGNLYGGTEYGGIQNGECAHAGCGVTYALHPQPSGQWKEFVLHAFHGGDDGYDPVGAVALHGGALYGTTNGGGTQGIVGYGTIYELTRGTGKNINEQFPWDFGANGAQGVEPEGGVVFDNRGDMFGATYGGGLASCGCGVVYGMKPQGNGKWGYAVLHAFDYSDGYVPDSGLTIDSKGNLYGTTQAGGPGEGGVVFELSPVKQASE